MSEEIRSKDLERYYKNQKKYNERAKTYFRNVWYVKNRESILIKMKEYRYSKNNKEIKVIHKPDSNLTVCFD